MAKNNSSNHVHVSIRCPAWDIYDSFLMSQAGARAIEWFIKRYNECGDVAEFEISTNETNYEELDI